MRTTKNAHKPCVKMQCSGVQRVWTMQRCSVLLCIALQQRNHPLSRSALFFHIKNTYKLQRGYVIINTWIISGVAARKCLLKQTATSWSVIINDTWIISGVAARKCLLKQMDRADRPGRLLQYALGSF